MLPHSSTGSELVRPSTRVAGCAQDTSSPFSLSPLVLKLLETALFLLPLCPRAQKANVGTRCHSLNGSVNKRKGQGVLDPVPEDLGLEQAEPLLDVTRRPFVSRCLEISPERADMRQTCDSQREDDSHGDGLRDPAPSSPAGLSASCPQHGSRHLAVYLHTSGSSAARLGTGTPWNVASAAEELNLVG